MLSLITDHLDIWTAAPVIKANTGRGRVSAAKQSPYGIKKLRELILELAVRGMLVDQDPNDESASVLLEKIAKEKGRLVKEGKIKKQNPLPEISEEEKPFDLPDGWEWTRLGQITQINPRNEAADELTVAFVPMPLISTSHTGEHGQEIKSWGKIKNGYTHFADGDIGVAKITPCFENSKAVVFCGLENGVGAGTTELHIARPFGTTLVARYILLFLKSPMFLHVGGTKMTGTAGQKRLPKEFFSETPAPLPPLAEQHRIVAKVDELMALCARLEQQQGDGSATHQTLVETLLATLTTAADHQGFAEAWHRIAGHFDTLFTTEESIDQFKQTILQLAVQGKLVPQDPNDEPASVLLTKIAKEGKLKKQKSLPEISEDDIPHAIPTNWSWAYFQNVTALITDGEHATPPRVSLAGIPMATAKNIRDGFIDLRDTDFVSEETARKCWKRCRPEHDDILMVCVGATTGRLTVIKEPEKFIMVRSVALIRPFSPHILPEYLALSLRSPIGQKQIWENVRQSAQPCLYIGKMNELQVSIPPLAEQHRIVAKVDDLMALCDQLKAKLTQSQERSEKLVDAMFQQLLVA